MTFQQRLVAFGLGILLCSTAITPGFIRVANAGSVPFDLAIDAQVDPETLAQGETFTVTIDVTNNGPASSPSATASVPIPAGSTFQSASSSSGTVVPPDGENGTLQVIFDALGEGEGVNITVNLTATADPGEMIEGSASVSAGETPDEDPGNDSVDFFVTVEDGSEADLSLDLTADDDFAGSDSLFGYVVEVSNNSETSTARSVTITASVPDGTEFADAFSSDGEVSDPGIGNTGEVVCVIEEIAPGEFASLEVIVLVTADPGEFITFEASTSSASNDPNPDDNEGFVDVEVIPSEEVMLDWDEPDLSDPDVLAPPRNLIVFETGARWDRARADQLPRGLVTPEAGLPARRASLIGFNIYRGTNPGSPPSPSHLLMSVPPSQTSSPAPAAPSGTFFVVTAVYDTGESMPSNEASANIPSATVTSLKVKGSKITATGSGFSPDVQVFVDGIPFVTAAKVKKQNTKVQQKGNLVTGMPLAAYIQAHPSVVISFRNNNGGVTQIRYPQ